VKQHDGKDDKTGVRIDPSKVFISGVFSLQRMSSLYTECVLSVFQFLPGIDICTLLLLLLCVCALYLYVCVCVCSDTSR
jgi:hypothetical protein